MSDTILQENLLINGRRLPALSGETIQLLNPVTNTALATVAEGNREDVDQAVESADRAYERGTLVTD